MNAKATPRPWVFKVVPTSIGRCFKIGSETQVNDVHGSICLYDDSTSFNPRSHEQAESDAALIVKAVNEYEALNAVAEAAERFRKYYFDDLAKSNRGFLSKLVLQDYEEMMAVCIALPRALNALATVRAKEVA